MKPHVRSCRHLDKDNKPIHGKVITHVYHMLLRKDFSEREARVRYENEVGNGCSMVRWHIHPSSQQPRSLHKGPGCCLWEAYSIPLSSLHCCRDSLDSARVRSLGNPRPRNLLASYYTNTEVHPFLKNRPFLGLALPTLTASSYAQTFCYHELPAIY